jgi:hypothetical protein
MTRRWFLAILGAFAPRAWRPSPDDVMAAGDVESRPGRCRTICHADGSTTILTYDSYGRLVRRVETVPPGRTNVVTYRYSGRVA